jgi:putative membrane protein
MYGLHRLPWAWVIGGGLQLLILIGLLVLIIVGIWALIRSIRRPVYSISPPAGPMQTSNKALDIVKERYARGEINKEEYDRLKTDLNS